MQKIIKVGNIEFTSKGVLIVRNYSSTEEVNAYLETSQHKISNETTLHIAKCAIKERIEHCKSELQKHFAEATLITQNQVIWNGGHFTIPVYQEMVDFVERDVHSWDDVSPTMLNQILRALYSCRYIAGASINDIRDTFFVASELLTIAAHK